VTIAPAATATIAQPDRNRLAGWRRLPRKAKAGCIVLAVIILVAIAGPYIAPDNPSVGSSVLLHGPSLSHLLGTTSTGQDVLSQILVGTRSTVVIALAAGTIATVIALIVGMAAGFLGGLWDELLSLVSNVFLVLPALPLLVVLLSYQSARGDLGTILVLSALGWPWGARIMRSQTLSLRNRDFVAAARETGERTWRILLSEILPSELNLAAASFVGAVLYALSASVALAFLGLTDTSQWSLGTILFWAQTENALNLGAWWWFISPGLLVAIIGVALVLVNSGLDELGNPRLRVQPRQPGRGRRPARWLPSDPTPVERRTARPRPGGLSPEPVALATRLRRLARPAAGSASGGAGQ
jgi:peptide/nickel transport system permease protein